jgi:D-glucosaminate-6-phosphate ammonia-lyase
MRPLSEHMFCSLGCRPVVNACGVYTDLGGSILSPRVWQAMQEANECFVSMPELLDQTGRIVAGLMEAEAARITMSASAAITLATAACMAGSDGDKMDRLPDSEGMKNRVLIQKRHRYKYDRMVRSAGGHLVEVGDSEGTTAEQLADALDDQTAAICFPAHLNAIAGSVSLSETCTMAHARGVPVIVDAAYLNFPVALMPSFGRQGADVVIFSAKYFSGPNAGGIMYGRSDLLEAVALADFVRHESGAFLKFGRAFKQDRQTVVGVLEALREWLEMDHEQRFADYRRRVERMASILEGIPGVKSTPMHLTMAEDLVPEPVNCLLVEIDASVQPSSDTLSKTLADGNPSILTHLRGDSLILDVECASDSDAELIGRRLRGELRMPVPA